MKSAVRLFVVMLALLLVPGPGFGGDGVVLSHSRYLAGSLLVAAPSMPDPRFSKTVIYMVEHDADGAFGLVVNRPMGTFNLGDLMRELALDADADAFAKDVSVRYGGPVQPEFLWVLHSSDWTGAGTRYFRGPIAMSAGPDVLEAISHDEGPLHYQIIMGYSGWGPNQLESEMERDDWITAPLDLDLVFGDDDDEKWFRASDVGGVAL